MGKDTNCFKFASGGLQLIKTFWDGLPDMMTFWFNFISVENKIIDVEIPSFFLISLGMIGFILFL